MPVIYKYKNFPPEIRCRIETNFFSNNPIKTTLHFKFDTGADCTLVPATVLGVTCSKQEFTETIQQSSNITVPNPTQQTGHLVAAKLQGVLEKSKEFEAYALQVDSFKIFDYNSVVDLKSVPIFVCFDSDFTDILS